MVAVWWLLTGTLAGCFVLGTAILRDMDRLPAHAQWTVAWAMCLGAGLMVVFMLSLIVGLAK